MYDVSCTENVPRFVALGLQASSRSSCGAFEIFRSIIADDDLLLELDALAAAQGADVGLDAQDHAGLDLAFVVLSNLTQGYSSISPEPWAMNG